MFFNRNTPSSGHSRPEHISSYLNDPTLKRSTRKMSKDDSTYDTIFQTKNTHTLLIRVHIPPSSSSSFGGLCPAPQMTLVGIEAAHPWIDPSTMKVIGYGPISSTTEFNNSKLLLSQVVNAVVQHFQLNPPSALRIVDESLKKMQPVGSIDENGYEITLQQRQQRSQQLQQQVNDNNGTSHRWFGRKKSNKTNCRSTPNVPTIPKVDEAEIHFSDVIVLNSSDQEYVQKMLDTKYRIPPPPTVIPELSSITSQSDIISLLTDTNQLLPILEQNSTISTTEQLKNTLLSTNHITATTNLSTKDQLESLHNDCKTLQSTLKSKMDRYNTLKEKQMDLCKPMNKEYVLKKLKKGKKEAMNESDGLAYEWLKSSNKGNGEESIDEERDVELFIKEFLEKRIVHHVRAAKEERIEYS